MSVKDTKKEEAQVKKIKLGGSIILEGQAVISRGFFKTNTVRSYMTVKILSVIFNNIIAEKIHNKTKEQELEAAVESYMKKINEAKEDEEIEFNDEEKKYIAIIEEFSKDSFEVEFPIDLKCNDLEIDFEKVINTNALNVFLNMLYLNF